MAPANDPLSQWFAIPALFIIFRETLEGTVLVAVLVQYLRRAGQIQLEKSVWYGATVGSFASLLIAIALLSVYYIAANSLDPLATSILEASMLMFASVMITFFFITHLAPGMKSKKQWKSKWEHKMGKMVHDAMRNKDSWNFFCLSFTTILREGIEASVFIIGIGAMYAPVALIFPSLCGFLIGCLVGFAMFLGSAKFNMTGFFVASAVFLLFVAAGLAAHASYEIQKAGVFGTWSCVSAACEGDDPAGIDDAVFCDDTAYTAYRRRLLAPETSRRLTTARAQSCDNVSGEHIAWVNQELWDATACCDTTNMFFFLLMVLFWYRPAPTNLEMLVYVAYWCITVAWGYGMVRMIKEDEENYEACDDTDCTDLHVNEETDDCTDASGDEPALRHQVITRRDDCIP